MFTKILAAALIASCAVGQPNPSVTPTVRSGGSGVVQISPDLASVTTTVSELRTGPYR